jgi:hypothetical protein
LDPAESWPERMASEGRKLQWLVMGPVALIVAVDVVSSLWPILGLALVLLVVTCAASTLLLIRVFEPTAENWLAALAFSVPSLRSPAAQPTR